VTGVAHGLGAGCLATCGGAYLPSLCVLLALLYLPASPGNIMKARCLTRTNAYLLPDLLLCALGRQPQNPGWCLHARYLKKRATGDEKAPRIDGGHIAKKRVGFCRRRAVWRGALALNLSGPPWRYRTPVAWQTRTAGGSSINVGKEMTDIWPGAISIFSRAFFTPLFTHVAASDGRASLWVTWLL